MLRASRVPTTQPGRHQPPKLAPMARLDPTFLSTSGYALLLASLVTYRSSFRYRQASGDMPLDGYPRLCVLSRSSFGLQRPSKRFARCGSPQNLYGRCRPRCLSCERVCATHLTRHLLGFQGIQSSSAESIVHIHPATAVPHLDLF